jgi:hypothetical protein
MREMKTAFSIGLSGCVFAVGALVLLLTGLGTVVLLYQGADLSALVGLLAFGGVVGLALFVAGAFHGLAMHQAMEARREAPPQTETHGEGPPKDWPEIKARATTDQHPLGELARSSLASWVLILAALGGVVVGGLVGAWVNVDRDGLVTMGLELAGLIVVYTVGRLTMRWLRIPYYRDDPNS